MTELSHSLLTDAALCFTEARRNVYQGASMLYEIQQENLWEGQYSSFSEYVEQECQLSKGYASKLLQAWKYYVIDGGVLQAKLEGIDSDKLYFAMKLPEGTVEQRLVMAQELSRDDLRQELASKDGVDCQHPEDKRVVICGICSKRVG